jgi:four helix bundle protein
MPTIRQFEDILSWQKARDLTRGMYATTRKDEFSKDFALKDQIRRAAISITSNIAEGFERDGSREFVQFLSHAKGSCGEVRSQLYLALDAGYLNEEEWKTLHQSCLEISRLLDSFSNYLRDTGIKGSKFKKTSTSSQLET